MIAKHVSPDYRHEPKRIWSAGAVTYGSSLFKWYDLAAAETPVAPDVKALARAFLARASAKADWRLDEDVGFVILHRCGAAFYFLIVCSWRGNNELWQTVYFKPNESAEDFALFPQGDHKGTFCIWEAGIVRHEVAAWSRYLRSPRTAEDMEAYLNDWDGGDVV